MLYLYRRGQGWVDHVPRREVEAVFLQIEMRYVSTCPVTFARETQAAHGKQD